jgi:Mlc titration factor MtfA (ptsG expression regulator)
MMRHVLQSILEAFLRALRPGAQRRQGLDDAEWHALRDRVPFMTRLTETELMLLRERVGEFLSRHRFVGIRFELRPWQEHLIAAYACLPILHLGIRCYRDWRTLVVYPDTFAPEQEWMDDDGVHHRAVVAQAGEAWEGGPVVLSWSDIVADGAVIVHEMVHTLDAANGGVNGFPPLPAEMSAHQWTETFSAAFETLNAEIEAGQEPSIDPYAATDPAEFLAVSCEYFFFMPGYLLDVMPEVYGQLANYFRQQPHLRGDEIATLCPGANASL